MNVRSVAWIPKRVQVVSAAVICACGGPSVEPAELDTPAVMISAAATAQDTLSRHLITRQRALFAAIANKELNQLANYLAVNFVWGRSSMLTDERLGSPRLSRVSDERTDFFGMVAGATPPILDSMPSEFEVTFNTPQTRALVAAYYRGRESVIWTNWRLRSGAWLAEEALALGCRVPISSVRRLTLRDEC